MEICLLAETAYVKMNGTSMELKPWEIIGHFNSKYIKFCLAKLNTETAGMDIISYL